MFKKYPSAENHYRAAFVEKCFREYGHLQWAATEKIHGANFGIWVNDLEVQFSKRSGMIAPLDNFYNHLSFANRYASIAKTIRDYLWLSVPMDTIDQGDFNIVIFGEIYGPGVQKGINYTDEVDFIMFDIGVQHGETFHWLDYAELRKIEMKFNMPMVPEIKVGSFHEVLETCNEFDSILGGKENNNAEGFVMKPVSGSTYFHNGDRAIIKSKGVKWEEKAKKAKKIKVPYVLTDLEQKELDTLCQYFTDNRLKNVLSKIGAVTPKQFGMVMGLFVQDALVDFAKDEEMELSPATKKQGQTQAAMRVRENWVNIINGEF